MLFELASMLAILVSGLVSGFVDFSFRRFGLLMTLLFYSLIFIVFIFNASNVKYVVLSLYMIIVALYFFFVGKRKQGI